MKYAIAFGMALLATLLMASGASAGISITSPKGTDVWNAGAKDKSVTFTYDRGCSGGTAKLTYGLREDWKNNFPAQSGSPASIPVGSVPTNGNKGTKVQETCTVSITQTDGTQASDSVNFNIQN